MSAQMLKRLLEQRQNLASEMRQLLDAADSENRNFSAEEDEKYERLNGELDTLDKRATTLREGEEREKRAEEFRSQVDPLIRPTEDPIKRSEEEGLEAEFRSFLAGDRKRVEVRADKPMNLQELRTLSKLTSGAGGNTVKTSFYNRLIAHLIEVSGIMLAGPTLLTTTTGEKIQIPKTTAHSTATLIAEAGTISASDPAFGQAELDAYKYALLLQVSNELVTDTSVDLLGYLALEAGRAVGNAFGSHAITGDGSSKPNGVLTASTAGVTGAGSVAGVFTADNLVDLFYSVIAPYRNSPSAAWMMRDASMGAVRKLKDSNGQYLWQPSMQVGEPDTLLGKPVRTDPNMPAVAATAKSVLFGDFSRYFVRQVNGIRFERSDDFAFSSDLVTFRCIWRGDGELVDTTGAVKHFVGGAA
jgi:HK97 family phage major capsid protein